MTGHSASGDAGPAEPLTDEIGLLANADLRARDYLEQVSRRRVFPDEAAIARLDAFDEPLPSQGRPARETLAFLDDAGSPATVASTGGRYFGFVIGGSLPVAAAADRLALAWDQCASSFVNSPASATIERVAAAWVLEALSLPSGSGVGFGTSASACTLACLAAARRTLLERKGWDLDSDGIHGAPEVKVAISALAHVTVKKALRILGFGSSRIVLAPVDAHGRVDPSRLPALDDLTILCLQAGEVNTGEFDPFPQIIAAARAAGAWVHVDGAFGLWAKASPALAHLAEGVEQANSWTTDGHKWLNTPYDGAIAICRDAGAMAAAMNSDAPYVSPAPGAQRNLTLEFSRRPRGIAIWAALRTLGKNGVAEMVERHCRQAKRLAEGLEEAGFELLNRVRLNQVLFRAASDDATGRILEQAQQSGRIWFGGTVWDGRPAMRLSVSSWRTADADIEEAISTLAALARDERAPVASAE